MPFQKLQLDGRTRVIIITGLTAAGYVVLVYLIFFLTYTPVDIDHVRGVQGRYFVIALPVAAVHRGVQVLGLPEQLVVPPALKA